MASNVNIKPGVSVLAVLRHLNYKPWYALGEFVDNAVQSFIKNQSQLVKIEGGDLKLRVDIDIDSAMPARISVRDNAAGISKSDYGRAFRPAALPPDRKGLAEFGMGMKSAACWFAPKWSVRTSALGETVSREVRFDIKRIVSDNLEELSVQEVQESTDAHYTEIRLENIFREPQGRTIGKIKEHLTDIYRGFMRDGFLVLSFNGEVLKYTEPKILRAPYFKEPDSQIKTWRKEITFDFGEGLLVHGFAALLERANTAKAGFALFRRGRVIQGSGDEGYRPSYIFGQANSFRYQRLFGELHLEGFEVSHTKDGFRWDENEETFLQLLREFLDEGNTPLLKQAEGYRVRVPNKTIQKVAREAVGNVTKVLQETLPNSLPSIVNAQPLEASTEQTAPKALLVSRNFDIEFSSVRWSISIELTNDQATCEWVILADRNPKLEEPRELNIRVSMAHPFMVRFAKTDPENIEGLLRLAAAMSLAEVIARDAGVSQAGAIRRYVNDILYGPLAQP